MRTEEAAVDTRSKGYTPSKRERGVVTPKRTGTQARRVTTPPANRREALAQTRDARKRERIEQREAMMNGEESALLPRDRGPEKALVRDLVDSRRNASSYFFFGLFIVLFMSVIKIPIVQYIGNLVFLAMLLAVIVDSVLLARRIKRTVGVKLPKLTPRWGGLYFYGVMRAVSFRRMRVPRPRVAVGDKI